jgi:arsenite-transporting ATPase
MMAVSESSRFHASLMKDGVDARRLIVNQVLPPSASDCRFCAAKRRVSKLLLFWLL